MEIIPVMMVQNTKPRRLRGYSLIEILMVVAVLSSVAAGAVVTVSNVTQATENTKLRRDVAVINRAIRLYMVNGGTFVQADLRNPGTMLSKLKTRASTDTAKQLAGVKHSMADERLNYEMQSTEESRSQVERARFIPDPGNPRFVIEKGGVAGIRRFFLDSSLSGTDYGTEDRAVNMKLAKTDPWVWDYNDTPNTRKSPGNPPPVVATTPSSNQETPANIPLNPPAFSLPSGADKRKNYPKTLTLLPTNPSGTAAISYSINGSPFIPYAGPINVAANSTVTAISVTLDPDKYDDSTTSSSVYTATAIDAVASIGFPKTGYNYVELGGPLHPSTPGPLPAPSATGTGGLANLDEFPVPFQNSTLFRYVWTVDGTNPKTSGTAQTQPDFTNGFIPAAIPVAVTAFGSSSAVTVKGAIKSLDLSSVNSSPTVSQALTAVALALRPPLATIDGRDVTLAPDVSGRDTPANVRIYYTTDGTDPGVDAAGNPIRGNVWTGVPFTLEGTTGSTQQIIARAYAPLAYPQFFTAAAPSTTMITLPPRTDVYVGGIFVNSTGNTMRNIAKLNNSGYVDTRFDTGTGASVDSLVGVVRQVGGGVMAGGDFGAINGVARAGAVLLTPAGAVDTSFNAELTGN